MVNVYLEHRIMNSIADSYTQIDTGLALAGIELSVSEVHGTIVGAVANHLKSGVTPDLLKLLGSQASNTSTEKFKDDLYELYRKTSEQLLEAKESFELLLPDDDESLQERVEGLINWTRGYLLGLLYNNAFSLDELPESGSEIVRDMMQITEAAVGADEEQEEDWALAELHEYVKVGAQLIFEFIYSERATEAPTQAQ